MTNKKIEDTKNKKTKPRKPSKRVTKAEKNKIRLIFVLPVCLLILNAVEEVIVYKLQTKINPNSLILNSYTVVFILVFMFALGFTIVGKYIVPKVEILLQKSYVTTHRKAGFMGLTSFYAIVIIIIYIIYYVIYIKGPQFLLPISWR